MHDVADNTGAERSRRTADQRHRLTPVGERPPPTDDDEDEQQRQKGGGIAAGLPGHQGRPGGGGQRKCDGHTDSGEDRIGTDGECGDGRAARSGVRTGSVDGVIVDGDNRIHRHTVTAPEEIAASN